MKMKFTARHLSKSVMPSGLIADVRRMIEETRSAVAVTVNAGLTILYWRIGKRISEEILKGERAGYGRQILATLSQELFGEYGPGFSEQNLRHMLKFVEAFPDPEILSTLWRELSWSHFKAVIYLEKPLQREFYAEICRVERWSVRTLRRKIDSMLYERTAVSRKPDKLAKREITELREKDRMSPDTSPNRHARKRSNRNSTPPQPAPKPFSNTGKRWHAKRKGTETLCLKAIQCFCYGNGVQPVRLDTFTKGECSMRPLVLGLFVLLAASATGHAQEGRVPPNSGGNVMQMYAASVLDYAAKGDGTTDDTGAFQAALDAAAPKGGSVFVPVGTYLIAGSLSVPQGVTLKGVWESPHHADIGKGSILYATGNKGKEDAAPFILLHQSSAVVGMTVFYPEQSIDDIQAYPWCIQGMGMHGSVINVTLVNPYKGIDFGTNPNELHFISNVFGQPLKVGIFIDKTTDIGRIENVHFNPHSWGRAAFPGAPSGGEPWEKLQRYLEENFVGFLIGQTDWEYMRDCFCIFPKIGFHFVRTERGAPNVVLTQCGADICSNAVRVDASQGHAGIAFENGQFMGTVIIGPENEGPVKLSNCGFWPIKTTNEQVIISGKNTVTLTACHFAGWGMADPNAPCVRVDGGAALLTNCDFFDDKKPQIYIGENVDGVAVTNCRLRGGAKIQNHAQADRVQIGQNIER
jgi:hypothetical protein